MSWIRLLFLAGSLFGLLSTASWAGSDSLCDSDPTACKVLGVKTYLQRCALCHGRDGRGEGILPLALKNDYPNTNLAAPKHPTDLQSVINIVRFGGSAFHLSSEMPPWENELNEDQIQAVSHFVVLLRNDLVQALKLVKTYQDEIEKPSLTTGRIIFQARCSLCHGKEGTGDGRMAALIKNPPPFNLTLSRAPDDYLKKIIKKGGAGVGRSPRMPPWETDLSEKDIESIILYLKSIRQ